jgi:hypothetical protein
VPALANSGLKQEQTPLLETSQSPVKLLWGGQLQTVMPDVEEVNPVLVSVQDVFSVAPASLHAASTSIKPQAMAIASHR